MSAIDRPIERKESPLLVGVDLAPVTAETRDYARLAIRTYGDPEKANNRGAVNELAAILSRAQTILSTGKLVDTYDPLPLKNATAGGAQNKVRLAAIIKQKERGHAPQAGGLIHVLTQLVADYERKMKRHKRKPGQRATNYTDREFALEMARAFQDVIVGGNSDFEIRTSRKAIVGHNRETTQRAKTPFCDFMDGWRVRIDPGCRRYRDVDGGTEFTVSDSTLKWVNDRHRKNRKKSVSNLKT